MSRFRFDRVGSRTSFGFTLMEVNLAIFIMAVGLLAMVALYPLAYRESRQSKDDVKAAAAADCVLNALTGTLSSRNIEWHDWVDHIKSSIDKCNKGWLSYCDQETYKDTDGRTKKSWTPKKKGQITSLAKEVFSELSKINPQSAHRPPWPVDNDLACAIVVQWGQIPVGTGTRDDRSRVAISLRVTRRAGDLLGQPLFYTEVHFQGDQKDVKDPEEDAASAAP